LTLRTEIALGRWEIRRYSKESCLPSWRSICLRASRSSNQWPLLVKLVVERARHAKASFLVQPGRIVWPPTAFTFPSAITPLMAETAQPAMPIMPRRVSTTGEFPLTHLDCPPKSSLDANLPGLTPWMLNEVRRGINDG
jgi:hypothetical protein